MIATWNLDLDKILQAFKVRSVIRAKTSAKPPIPEGICNKFGHFHHPL